MIYGIFPSLDRFQNVEDEQEKSEEIEDKKESRVEENRREISSREEVEATTTTTKHTRIEFRDKESLNAFSFFCSMFLASPLVLLACLSPSPSTAGFLCSFFTIFFPMR
jgi:hypothetical protein